MVKDYYAPELTYREQDIIRLSPLFICLLSVLTFAKNETDTSYLACLLHSDAISIDTKVNDHVTLTFMLKIAFSDFVVAMGIVFHQHILFAIILFSIYNIYIYIQSAINK